MIIKLVSINNYSVLRLNGLKYSNLFFHLPFLDFECALPLVNGTDMFPKFQFHKALGQIWVDMARSLSDSLIIPFDPTDYGKTLIELVAKFLGRFRTQLEQNDINTSTCDFALTTYYFINLN